MSSFNLTPDEEIVLRPADVSSYTPQHVVTRGVDVFGGGMLPDGRRAPQCMVVFMCSKCDHVTVADAYHGVPLHVSCPNASRPIMEPATLSMEHRHSTYRYHNLGLERVARNGHQP